jgi:coproporphyrinogen III oxidase-like Fe-S oxidoreductase
MSPQDPHDPPVESPRPRFDMEPPDASAHVLANVDQLPVYGRSAAGGAIGADRMLGLARAAIAGEANKDLLIYLHVPFCRYTCSFCDWVADIPAAQLTSGPQLRARYVTALCRQIRELGPMLMAAGYVPRYIYWGGGTPSRLEAEEYVAITDALKASCDLSTVREHVMEVTPDSLTMAKLEGMLAAGVTRLSMGVQSFNAAELRASGRGHSPEEADAAVVMLRRAGFTNFNIDLIVAFPEQTPEMLRHSLEQTLAHEPPHVTAYLYRPTPSTRMTRHHKKHGPGHLTREHMARAYAMTQSAFADAGYGEYTLGYFSKTASDRCGGEMYYFQLQGDWMGFGSGAVSILGHHRLKNHHGTLHRFLDDPLQFDACEYLPDRRVEGAIYALRQALVTETGIDYANFHRFFGFGFEEIRRHPAVRAFMGYYKYCGAAFDETATHLAITPETRANAYMNVWSKASLPAKTAVALRKAAVV